MTPQRAVLWIDHRSAKVLRLDAEPEAVETIRTYTHPTAQHGSAARTENEYYDEVCDALEGLTHALMTGSRMVLADFCRYVESTVRKQRRGSSPTRCSSARPTGSCWRMHASTSHNSTGRPRRDRPQGDRRLP